MGAWRDRAERCQIKVEDLVIILSDVCKTVVVLRINLLIKSLVLKLWWVGGGNDLHFQAILWNLLKYIYLWIYLHFFSLLSFYKLGVVKAFILEVKICFANLSSYLSLDLLVHLAILTFLTFHIFIGILR